ncbi:hypothetical protein FOCC_FOCC007154 [Frankliniella occidentalis]|nr:hypothetical protein FOCC_FOCC007154 [Frankliniella occidentalis]
MFSTEDKPMRELTCKDSFCLCQQAFNSVNKLLQSSDLLMHFNPQLPIVLCTDASPVSVGCVLAHLVNVNGETIERLVLFAFATLTSDQQNYSQIDREAFAVIFTVTLWGRTFVIATDYSAIQRMLTPEKGLSLRANHRLQHWATILQGFNYHIEYRKASLMSVPYALSHLPSPVNLKLISPLIKPPITVDEISEHSLKDSTFTKVFDVTYHGWPGHNPFPDHAVLTSYFKLRDEITIQQRCLMIGNRAILPPSLRGQALTILHMGHPGNLISKLLATAYFYWPDINSDKESLINNCALKINSPLFD